VKVPFNALARGVATQRDALLRATTEVLDSGWFVRGSQHEAFLSELRTYLGVAHVIGCGNGTDALELALRAARTDSRRTVLTVANAGGYASTAALAAGLRVRYVDVDPVTHNLDPVAIEDVIDDDTFAIVVTHLYGRVADVDGVRKAIAGRDVRIVEDCAQSFGASTATGRAGSLGDLATFSFYPTKTLGALGDGGAVATDDPHLAQRIAQLGEYGWVTKYEAALPGGRNSRLDELQAAYLRVRLPLVDAANGTRRAIITRYADAASSRIHVLPAADASHAAHLAVVVTDSAEDLATHLTEAAIGHAVHYPIPDHQQLAFADGQQHHLPVTDSLDGRILSLPLFTELTDAEITQVCDALAAY
jgi:dTDP-3-amino-2,3,6-trideoxy-4-keto-D-glucose/dTDP-3-amino-3,4,6-trideoxy-alpha-D-glucose/dTDP-2,6-dideoxy-D-kanosamine transaminase